MNNKIIACLLLLETMYDIPTEIFTAEIKEELLRNELAVLTDRGWFLTDLGISYIDSFKASKSKTNYNDTINSMSDAAVNAFCCASINAEHGFYNRLGINERRTLMQHLLNINYNKTMGEALVRKWHRTLTESIKYFDAKTRNSSRNIH